MESVLFTTDLENYGKVVHIGGIVGPWKSHFI